MAFCGGLLYGNATFLFTQIKGLLIVVAYSFTVSYLIFKFINLFQPIRVSQEEEEEGLDSTQHNEKYSQGTLVVNVEENGTLVEIEKSLP